MQDIMNVTGVVRLTKEPEHRSLPNGDTVVSMRVAWSQSKRGANGYEDFPGYIDVSYFGKSAEGILPYLSKGKQIAINGRLQYREWKTQDGHTRSALDIVAYSVQLLGGGRDSEQPSQARESLPEPSEPSTPNVPF